MKLNRRKSFFRSGIFRGSLLSDDFSFFLNFTENSKCKHVYRVNAYGKGRKLFVKNTAQKVFSEFFWSVFSQIQTGKIQTIQFEYGETQAKLPIRTPFIQ